MLNFFLFEQLLLLLLKLFILIIVSSAKSPAVFLLTFPLRAGTHVSQVCTKVKVSSLPANPFIKARI